MPTWAANTLIAIALTATVVGIAGLVKALKDIDRW